MLDVLGDESEVANVIKGQIGIGIGVKVRHRTKRCSIIGKERTVVRCWLRWSYSRQVTLVGIENDVVLLVALVVAAEEVTVCSSWRGCDVLVLVSRRYSSHWSRDIL